MIRSLNLHDKTEHIAIDGKVSRGCYHTKGQCLLRDVSAWDTQNGISLGQVSTRNEEGKEMGEFYAIPELVRMIDVEDRIVTIDAGGYYTEITEAIVDGNGLFLITLKANQPKLHEAVILEFQEHEKQGWKDVPRYHESNTGHGRQEERTYYAIDIPREMVDPKWKDVKTVITGIFRRTIGEKTTQEQHYFISNLAKEEVERIGMALRSHWGIENSLHWVLDVNFGEDANRTREGDGAENLSILRKIALMILNQGRGKISVSNAMFRAAIDPTFRKQLILNIPL